MEIKVPPKVREQLHLHKLGNIEILPPPKLIQMAAERCQDGIEILPPPQKETKESSCQASKLQNELVTHLKVTEHDVEAAPKKSYQSVGQQYSFQEPKPVMNFSQPLCNLSIEAHRKEMIFLIN